MLADLKTGLLGLTDITFFDDHLKDETNVWNNKTVTMDFRFLINDFFFSFSPIYFSFLNLLMPNYHTKKG
jgi:hypothetical protein